MSLQPIDPILEQIHDAALGTTTWESALASISNRLSSNSAVVSVEFKPGGGWGISTGGDARLHADYFEHYAGIHPMAQRCYSAPAGSILTDRMVMPKAEFRRTELYADWARPAEFDEMLYVRLENSEQTMVGFCLTRPSRIGEFEGDDLAIINSLAPHLRRAVATYQTLSEVRTSRQVMADALDCMQRGVFGLDTTGKIIFANQTARSLLAAGDALRSVGGLLAANRPDSTTALRRMVKAATLGEAPGIIAVQRPDGKSPLLVETVPIGSSAMMLDLRPPPAVLLLSNDIEHDRTPAATSLNALYGLTATEAAVAIHIARGKGVSAVAQTLRIAPSTVRTHLRHIFDKTGTHRQAELTWTIARLTG